LIVWYLIMKKITSNVLLGTLMAVAWANSAFALDLVADYQKALTYDPTFQTAMAERIANQASATQAKLSYLPEGSLSNQRLDTDTTTRQTVRVVQPIIDLQRFAALRQGAPREGFAEATFVSKQQDLALRLLKAANAIILANENLKLNAAKIDALNQQAMAAKRKLELGQGTITDLRDIEVKAAQSKAQQLNFKTARDVAAKQYAAITGEKPNISTFVLGQQDRRYKLLTAPEYVDMALQSSATLQAARFSERVAELDVQKSTGALLPTISATYNSSKAGELTNTYSGVLVSMPLQAGNYYSRKTVEANYLKSKEATRDIEQKTQLEVERLREQIETGLEALAIQKDAIAAAELSLEANQKSYEGGVRSTVDILNATQTVFQVKSEYITTLTTQTESIVSLLNYTHPGSVEALSAASKFLFNR
jgi:protease secretion system outer membrane protein